MVSGNRRALVDPTAVEAYIRGGVTPRFMQRLMDIEAAVTEHRGRLGFLYEDMRHACAADEQAFGQRWRALAQRWRFDRVNELIAHHNEYYPIERNLPIDLHTGDYLTISGRPYRREPLGPEWVLERFPPTLGARRRPGPDRGA
jgi:hypothetical protein